MQQHWEDTRSTECISCYCKHSFSCLSAGMCVTAEVQHGLGAVVKITGAALLDNNEATAKSTSQDGRMAGNFG